VLRQADRGGTRLLGLSPFEWLYLILVFSSPAYVTWMSITLMDTGLWGSLIAAAVCLSLLSPLSGRRPWLLGFVLGGMMLARPEAFAVVPGFLAVLFVRFCAEKGMARAWRITMWMGAAFLVMAAGLTGFRLLYYGYPLPNTFYAKVSPSLSYNVGQGLAYFHRYMDSSRIAALGLLVALVVLGMRVCAQLRRGLEAGSARAMAVFSPAPEEAVAVLGLLLLGIPVLTGGDHFEMSRFYQPVYPALCLLIALAARRCCGAAAEAGEPAGRWRMSLPVAAVLAVVVWWCKAFGNTPNWADLRSTPPIKHEFHIAERGAAFGEALQQLFGRRRPPPSVGVIAAGGIKRTYRGPVLDLMGLNNAAFGHGKGDRRGIKNHAAFEAGTFFRNPPEILRALPPIPPEMNRHDDICLKGMLTDPGFLGAYTYTEIGAATNGAISVCGFFRNDFLKELLGSGDYREAGTAPSAPERPTP